MYIRIKKIMSSINRKFSKLNGFLLLILTFLVVSDFVGRNISKPIQGLDKIAIFILIAVVYLGLPLCEEEKRNVKVTLLVSRLSDKTRRYFNLFSYYVATIVIFLCVWTSTIEAINVFISKQKTPGTVLFLTYPIKFILLTGLVFYLFQLIINTIEEYKKE